ncbi:hypothetical protein M426DRAFT_319079 [Hypoxylon sp. CI-4A]|nr:hypothetical protein M426DRAFT_319079 [Hypoxylon sp. CI-4A]
MDNILALEMDSSPSPPLVHPNPAVRLDHVDEPTEPTQSQLSPLDVAISQLLKEQPIEGDSTCSSEYREHKDLTTIRNIEQECQTGDTLIIVDFPSGFVDCRGERWTSKRFYAHSEKLLATGSKVFAELLSTKKQARFQKRLGIAGESCKQKYVLDLTPSSEGEELAAQLIQLSLPKGVREWWMSKERLGVSAYVVSGHDDHCPHHNKVPIDCVKSDQFSVAEASQPGSLPKVDLAHIEIPEPRVIEDYCPIRHRANILRLILAIHGHDLVLNSAPRVYALTNIAKIFDCASVVRDAVYSWLMMEPNTDFIDINTEAAFEIAWTLGVANPARAAFRILVVERALKSLAENQVPGAQRSVFGRPRIDLPDDLQTVVQYAAQKLTDRAHQTLASFKSDQFFDNLEVSEYRRLMKLGDTINAALSIASGQSNSKTQYSRRKQLSILHRRFIDLRTGLHQYQYALVSTALKAPPTFDQQRDFDLNRRCYVSRLDWTTTAWVYSSFSDAQHLLTPCFWDNLATHSHNTHSNLYPDRFIGNKVMDFNIALDESLTYLEPNPATEANSPGLHFDTGKFRDELGGAMDRLWASWIRADLEAPCTRSSHMVLSLSEDEFQYLPLWAGGLDDGTGGVFEATVPDADLGPIGPGPAYTTGITVATDVSSIARSEKTPSQASADTLTAGLSALAIAPSHTVASTVQHGDDNENYDENCNDDGNDDVNHHDNDKDDSNDDNDYDDDGVLVQANLSTMSTVSSIVIVGSEAEASAKEETEAEAGATTDTEEEEEENGDNADDDSFEFYDCNEISDDAWSEVDEL